MLVDGGCAEERWLLCWGAIYDVKMDIVDGFVSLYYLYDVKLGIVGVFASLPSLYDLKI